MPTINNTFLMGHMTRDADLRYTKNGKGVCNITLALNRQFGDGADFIDITLWNRGNYKLAEYAAKWKKGDLVVVEGSIRQDKWEKDGNTRTKIKINADTAYNLSRKKQGKQQDEQDFDTPF